VTENITKIDPLAPAGYLVAHRGAGLVLPRNKAFAYVVAANGLFKWARTRHFITMIKIVSWPRRPLPGLDRKDNYVGFTQGKIPADLLNACVGHARRNIHKEILYQFRIDGRKVRVAIPFQTGTAGRIEYQADEFDPGDVILDLHSHHTMSARFSAIDDRDETGLRFYGVIGRLDHVPCEIRLRVGIYGDFTDVRAVNIFRGHISPTELHWPDAI